MNTEDFLNKSTLFADNLPEPLKNTLQQFRNHANKEGILLLKNLPVESQLPATPTDNHKSSYTSESLLATIGARLGYLVGYAQEKNGSLFHDITPLQSEENEQSSMGSLVQLELHTERCFHPFLPDYLLLYCLRPDPAHKGFTTHAGIRQILPLLSQKHIETLFQPVFRTGIDYSFGNKKTRKANGPVMSVLYGNKTDPFIRYDLDLMTGLTSKAELALQTLKEIVIDMMDGIYLEAGSLLIMDNKRCVHGRGEFKPGYDGNDRWLQRSYVLTDLGPSACDRIDGSRVITTSFSTV
ncbi:MAG: TauD/TfdA family dioxygenase [Gammaproteobacteria bacterium]|nr:TauD/TfdA family dioxygenase [Gammaproteobacteria bacterium]